MTRFGTTAPKGAPNVLLVLIDDMGFGASSAFGGPVDMPTAQRLAEGGLRFNRFHTTALCSPTRASLLTGRNPHAVGFGTVTNFVSSDPGYNCIRPDSAATIATVLKENGYSTAAFGKWHQTPGMETGPAGPFDRWPTGEGFERFYGFVGGSTDQYYPALYDGVTPVECPATPEDGYHLSEDLADKLIDWVAHQQAAAPGKPFFGYLALGATHSPLQVPKPWRDKYAGQFAHGWNRQRDLTLRRQKQMGVVPDSAEMTSWPAIVPEWDAIGDDDRQAAQLLMELYAGFAEHTDAQVGRVVDALSDRGLLDNTLVCYILGDNGASAEGGLRGTANEGILFNGLADDAARILERAEELGSPTTAPQYPFGWALAMDTPYQWVKQMASHYGGTRNPLIIHWPNGIDVRGEVRSQWHFVSDIAPTILESAGITPPEFVNGVEQQPVDGVSMRYTFGDVSAPDRRTTQYFEVFGNRAIYHEGWIACTPHRIPMQAPSADKPFEDDVWELYDTTADWTENHDLAKSHPGTLAELQRVFLREAERNQVLLDNNRMQRMREGVPTRDIAPVVTYPGTMPALLPDAAVKVLNRSHAVSVRLTLDAEGCTGSLVAQGARADGGWSLYLREGRVAYCHNVADLHVWHIRSDVLLTTGAHVVRMESDYDGGGLGKGAAIRLFVDDEQVGGGRIGNSTAHYLGGTGLFTVGYCHGLPITGDYAPADRIAGTVHSVRVELGDGSSPASMDVGRAALASQ
ncbi:arylsulfatase [Nocardia speluncae]|uniref:Arylsulfatase n=1 Tax=Nocardia speluncae TaxID=419477 RepID=A0A846XEQ4_9NOCA|nr:arylsulfatase [Nocardia speluncae]NKY33210.1 arylsulfatase [Nocardia speluncae]